MLSQGERVRQESNVVRPRSRTPARRARRISRLAVDEQELMTASEDEGWEEGEEEENEAIVIDDDSPFTGLASSRRAPSTCRGSSSRGCERKRRRIDS